MNNKPEERFAKVKEVCDFLRISRNTAYRLIDDGDLSAIRIRGAIRVKWSSVSALVNGDRS